MILRMLEREVLGSVGDHSCSLLLTTEMILTLVNIHLPCGFNDSSIQRYLCGKLLNSEVHWIL